MGHLPPELVDRIIDYLHDDRPSLAACALAARLCTPSSQMHLFSHVFQRDENSSAHIAAFFRRSPHLARYVRAFGSLSGLPLRHLSIFPNVNTLRLSGAGAHPLHVKSCLDELMSINPLIAHLELHSVTMIDVAYLTRLPLHLSSLMVLDLHDIRVIDTEALPRLPSESVSLQTLRISGSGDYTLRWLWNWVRTLSSERFLNLHRLSFELTEDIVRINEALHVMPTLSDIRISSEERPPFEACLDFSSNHLLHTLVISIQLYGPQSWTAQDLRVLSRSCATIASPSLNSFTLQILTLSPILISGYDDWARVLQQDPFSHLCSLSIFVVDEHRSEVVPVPWKASTVRQVFAPLLDRGVNVSVGLCPASMSLHNLVL